jgi:ribonuclease R
MTARDFDDAISIRRKPGGGWLLGVHIADVGHYVRPGGALDREAISRGSSAYLPMRVVPMLPGVLSDGLCSLKEGEDRLALSVLLAYDRQGNLLEARAARSVIRSDRRFTYERASRVMEGAGGETREVAGVLREMFALARLLRARRPSLFIHEAGVEFVYSPAGVIVDVQTTEGDAAHWVIEEFMLAANREVAGWLLRIAEPALYRHHPPPGSSADLREFLAGAGIPGARQKPLPEVMRRAEEVGLGAAATSFLMDILESAEYTPRESSHDALGFAHYTHFTSPIRRYADLTVHRAVSRHVRPGKWTEMGGPREAPAEPAASEDLARLATHLNRRERAIAFAEGRLRRRRVLDFLAQRMAEPLAGVVLRTVADGLLVNLPGYLISGFIDRALLGPGARLVEPHTFEAGGMTYRPGREISVRIRRVDPAAGELDLALA